MTVTQVTLSLLPALITCSSPPPTYNNTSSARRTHGDDRKTSYEKVSSILWIDTCVVKTIYVQSLRERAMRHASKYCF